MRTEHAIDVDILNLSGGLFDRMLLTTPFEPAPEIVAPRRIAARAQARRAHRASQIVGIAAAMVLVVGLAAASQVSGAAPARKGAPSPAFAAALVAAPAPHCGGCVSVASAAEPSVRSEDVPAAQPPPTVPPPAAPHPTAQPVAAPATHRGSMEAFASIPVVAPTPSPLEALGAPRAGFDRAAAAIATALRGAGVRRLERDGVPLSTATHL